MLGVSLDLIKGVESGRNRLSQTVAARIFIATGADVSSLRKGTGKVNYLHPGVDYRSEHFKDWGQHTQAWPPGYVFELFRSIIGPHMLLLLLAAGRPMRGGRVRNRLASLLDSWARWEEGAVESFNLKPQINEVIQKCSPGELKLAGVKWAFAPGLRSLPDEVLNWLSQQQGLSTPSRSQHPRGSC